MIEVAKKKLNQREDFLTNIDKDEEKAIQYILKIGTSAGGARPKLYFLN